MVLDNIFSGKIRIALLTKLLLNPASKVYLRGLERDLGVSSNTVRLELNKLQEMHLIEAQDDSENTKVKNYVVNQGHPMFKTLRGIIMQFVGLDQIVDQIIKNIIILPDKICMCQKGVLENQRLAIHERS